MFSSHPFLWRLLLAVLVSGAVIAADVALLHAEPVSVQLRSGRTFTAEIDQRSSAQKLWLRFDRPQATVWRPIDWDRVVAAQQGDRTLTAAELRDSLEQLKTGQTEEVPPPEINPPEPNLPEPNLPSTAPGELPPPPQPRLTTGAAFAPPAPVQTRVQSIRLDAQLANFNSTAEADGVVVYVQPIDRHGNLITVEGTLDVELTGVIPNDFQTTNEFQTIGRWTVVVRPDEIGPNGARFELPFQAVHPEFNLAWAPKGIVHATFSVPGQGSFEAATGAVRIRAYNPIRDRLQQREGVRFFPTERTSRGDRE
ncbi:MAG TPA: hypothetical protein VFE24_16720 [Pirellulales bacterium]|jgi:hypothetical protein|nr:hypothetical protein [Pirellulales bacterium]